MIFSCCGSSMNIVMSKRSAKSVKQSKPVTNTHHLLLAGTAATLAVAVGLLTILLHQKALVSPQGVVSGVSTETIIK